MGFSYAPYAKAAALYRPDHTKLLIIQEAPPYALERHFYFTDVRAHDGLWVNFTRYAYKDDFGEEVAAERKRKDYWLGRCKKDGYQVIDSMREPMARNPHPKRVKMIAARAAAIVKECKEISPDQILLAKKSVYEALAEPVATAGLPLINEEALPFPGRGQQLRFLAGLDTLVEQGRLKMPT